MSALTDSLSRIRAPWVLCIWLLDIDLFSSLSRHVYNIVFSWYSLNLYSVLTVWGIWPPWIERVWQLVLLSTSLFQTVALSCYDVWVQQKKNCKKNLSGLHWLLLTLCFMTFCFQLKSVLVYAMYRKGSICISKVKPSCPSYTVGVKILINPSKGGECKTHICNLLIVMCSNRKIRHWNMSGLKLALHILVPFPTVAHCKGLHRQEASHLLSDSLLSPLHHV